jgi:hypothetical protein
MSFLPSESALTRFAEFYLTFRDVVEPATDKIHEAQCPPAMFAIYFCVNRRGSRVTTLVLHVTDR